MAFNLADAIANDFAFFDAAGTATLVDFDGVETSVAGVTNSPLSKQRAAMLGPAIGVEDEARTFSLPVANLGSVTPQQGYKIVDDADRVWTVVSCDLKTIDIRWSAVCVLFRGASPPGYSMSLVYSTNQNITDGQFYATNQNPRNFPLVTSDPTATRFLLRLHGNTSAPTNCDVVQATSTSGSINFPVYGVDDNGNNEYALNSWYSSGDPFPFQNGETVTFTVV